MPYSRTSSKKFFPTVLTFILVTFLILGFLTLPRIQQARYQYLLPPADQPQTSGGGFFEQASSFLANLFQPVAESLGFSTAPPPGSEPVGIESEFGITSYTGQSVVFSQTVLSGVMVGQVGMAGVYVKPGLGQYNALKLYDEKYPDREGEIWVKPIVNVRVFNGTPEAYSFTMNVKVVVDGKVVDVKTVKKEGSGSPPMKLEMDKVSVKGKTLHQILAKPGKGSGTIQEVSLLQKQVVEGKRLCFYADYEGLVLFEDPLTGESEPVFRKLENALLGCFDFAVAETGDFEMKIDKEKNTAPVAEVMVSGYMEVEKLVTTTKVITYTVTKETTYTKTTTVTYYTGSGKSGGGGGGSSGGTPPPTEETPPPTPPSGGGGTSTSGGESGGSIWGPVYKLMSGVIIIQYPYSEFIFIGKG